MEGQPLCLTSATMITLSYRGGFSESQASLRRRPVRGRVLRLERADELGGGLAVDGGQRGLVRLLRLGLLDERQILALPALLLVLLLAPFALRLPQLQVRGTETLGEEVWACAPSDTSVRGATYVSSDRARHATLTSSSLRRLRFASPQLRGQGNPHTQHELSSFLAWRPSGHGWTLLLLMSRAAI